MGIAHRTIRASRSHIPVNRKLCKSLPTSVKTLGDQIRLKRHEKNLTPSKAAQLLGIPLSLFNAWELDLATPSQTQWGGLAGFLGLDAAQYWAIPTAE